MSFPLFRQAVEAEIWPDMLQEDGTLDVHSHSQGSAMLAVLWWLAEIVPSLTIRRGLTIITGWGKSRKEWGMSKEAGAGTQDAVLKLLQQLGIPCEVDSSNVGQILLDLTGFVDDGLRGLFPEQTNLRQKGAAQLIWPMLPSNFSASKTCQESTEFPCASNREQLPLVAHDSQNLGRCLEFGLYGHDLETHMKSRMSV